MGRLLLITTRWPTPDRPAAGTFVRERVGEMGSVDVIAPSRYSGSRMLRLAALIFRAVTARGRHYGVEVHFLLPAGPIGVIAARLRRLPLLVYAHGSDVRGAVEGRRVVRWLARVVAKQADAIVTNSADSAAYIRELGRTAIVIPPGVDLRRFRPSPRPAQRTVLYLGGGLRLKGHDIALGLADTLAGPGIHEVSPDEIPGLMAAHDVILVPSREEGYGLVAAEAIASGRWVVAAAVGGLLEIVQDGVNGTLVRDGDFAGALARVPDYDPFAVASTAESFDGARSRARLCEVWTGLTPQARCS